MIRQARENAVRAGIHCTQAEFYQKPDRNVARTTTKGGRTLFLAIIRTKADVASLGTFFESVSHCCGSDDVVIVFDVTPEQQAHVAHTSIAKIAEKVLYF